MRRADRLVLIVDDYGTMRRIVRNLLGQIGFEQIDEAEDGKSALDKLQQRSFDLVISDWQMEPMSGLDLLKAVRGDARFRHLPFIMITAANKTENVIAAKAAGVSNYVVKPFTVEVLKRKIDTVLGA